MTVYRCFAWDRRVGPAELGGALCFPRALQGDGRHDNPEAYGCLYLATVPVAAVVEQLARFRGSVLVPGIFQRRGLPLALATIELVEPIALVDLDNPRELGRRGWKPSLVATRQRTVTQPQARAIHASGADGIRWWSTFESLWANLTLFDRAADRLRLLDTRLATLREAVVREASEFLGIATG